MKKVLLFTALALVALASCVKKGESCLPCDEPALYGVTVTSEPAGGGTATAVTENGTASAAIEAAAGLKITLDAGAAEGYLFTGWSVTDGGAILSDAAANPAVFTMPSNDVIVKALFARKRYSVTVSGDGHGSAVAGIDGEVVLQAVEGDVVTLDATPDPGYAFDAWEVVTGAPLTLLPDTGTASVTFTMPGRDVAVRAEFVQTTNHADYYGTWKYRQNNIYWYQITITEDKLVWLNYSGSSYAMEELTWNAVDNEAGGYKESHPTGYEFTGKASILNNTRILNPDRTAYINNLGEMGIDGWYISADGNSLVGWNMAPGLQLYYGESAPHVKMLAADRSVGIGTQVGTMIAGEAGTVRYQVMITTDFPAGDYAATVSNLPAGVTVGNGGKVTTNFAGAGELLLQGDGTQSAGTRADLTLTINGVTSDAFTLEIIL